MYCQTSTRPPPRPPRPPRPPVGGLGWSGWSGGWPGAGLAGSLVGIWWDKKGTFAKSVYNYIFV